MRRGCWIKLTVFGGAEREEEEHKQNNRTTRTLRTKSIAHCLERVETVSTGKRKSDKFKRFYIFTRDSCFLLFVLSLTQLNLLKKNMGKLIPRCFAANSDTVYFLARAVSTNDKTGPEMVALVKSDPYPASIQEAKWTVVNNTTSRFFSSWYNRYYMSGDLSCTVDDNGVFIFTGQYSSSGARNSYRYDPLAPRDANHKTLPTNATGEWTALITDSQYSSFPYYWGSSSDPDPFILFNANGKNNANNTNNNNATTSVPSQGSNSTQFMLQYKFGNSRGINSVPSIHYWTFNSSGYPQDSKHSYLVSYSVGKGGTRRESRK